MLRRTSHATLALLLLTTVVWAQPPAVEASNPRNTNPRSADRNQNISRRDTAKAAAAIRLLSKAQEQRVDASVESGLTWLAEQQNKKGFWTGLIGHKLSQHYMALRPLEEQRRAGTGLPASVIGSMTPWSLGAM